MSNSKIRVLLADDHQMVLEGFEAILLQESDIEIVGKALDGKHAIAILESTEVDIAVLDLSMPKMDGAETLNEIQKRFPTTHVLALTMHKDPALIKKMLNAGARGYILKNRGRKDLMEGIRQIMQGGTFWSPDVADIIVRSLISTDSVSSPEEVHITDMERQVLELVAEGMTSKEIADKLCRAESTVNTHKENLKKKLNLKNEKLLVRYAVENGYVK